MIYYILQDGKVAETDDVAVLEEYLRSGRNVVAQTTINEDYRVSTMLMGRDLNTHGMIFPDLNLPKELFETAVIGGAPRVELFRHTTLEEARKAHEVICEEVRRKVAGQAE